MRVDATQVHIDWTQHALLADLTLGDGASLALADVVVFHVM